MADWKLKHFKPEELLFDKEQSFRILQYFAIEPGITPAAFTDEDRSFAQALLVAAVDSSYQMGFVHAIFDVFYMKPAASVDDVSGMCKEFLEKAVENWFEHATKEDLREAKIYDYVRTVMGNKAQTAWRIRVQTGEMIY